MPKPVAYILQFVAVTFLFLCAFFRPGDPRIETLFGRSLSGLERDIKAAPLKNEDAARMQEATRLARVTHDAEIENLEARDSKLAIAGAILSALVILFTANLDPTTWFKPTKKEPDRPTETTRAK